MSDIWIIDPKPNPDMVEVAQKWIPVIDRLPNDGECVLVWGCGFIEIGWYDMDDKHWRTDDFTYEDGEVTHWTQLPKPPKED